MLTNRTDAAAGELLRHALGHGDPDIRGVAARAAGVGGWTALVPRLTELLEKETDAKVAAEYVRALLFLRGDEAVTSISRYLKDGGQPSVLVFAEWLARTQPEQFATRVGEFVELLPPRARVRIAPIVAMAAETHPLTRERILTAWLRTAEGDEWESVLDQLGPKLWTAADVPVLREALRSDKGALREATVWSVVAFVAADVKLPFAILDAVPAPAPVDDRDLSWEAFGLELVARHHRRGPPRDRSAWLRTEVTLHASHARRLVGFDRLTREEGQVLNAALKELPAGLPSGRRPVREGPASASPGALMRTMPVPWAGFLTKMLAAGGCPIPAQPKFAGVRIARRPDGRAAKLYVDGGNLAPECQPALIAMARLSVPGPADVTTEASPEFLILSADPVFIACADVGPQEPPDLAPARDRLGDKIKSPERTRHVRPEYPADAQKRRVEGVVIVEAAVAPTGCVSRAKIIRSVETMIDFSALRAVSGWAFTPTEVNGTPLPVILTVSVNFTLR